MPHFSIIEPFHCFLPTLFFSLRFAAMEEASISHSPSGLSPEITELTSADKAISFVDDQSNFEVKVSTTLSPTENPGLLAQAVLSSKEKGENAEFLAGNLTPGEQSPGFAEIDVIFCPWKSMPDCETICAAPCDGMQETKGDCVLVMREGNSLFGSANGKPKESSGSDIPEMRAIQKEATGLKVLGAAPGKLSEKIDAAGDDFRCSLEIELIDDTAVIGLSTIGIELETGSRKKVMKEPKKEKKPRRRSRAAKKDSDENKNSSNLKVSTGNSTGYKRIEKAKKMAYSRKTMEALRYWNVKGQRKLWQEIYNAFSPTMRTEYEELGCFRNQNMQSGLIWDINRAPAVLGMAAARGGCLNHYVKEEKFSGYLWGRTQFF